MVYIQTVGIVVGVLFFLLSRSTAHSQEQAVTFTDNYIANEVVVTYKQGYAPQQVLSDIATQQERAENVVGKVQNAAEGLVRTLQGEEPLEKRLEAVAEIKQEVGVVEESTVAQTVAETVVYKTDGEKPIETVIDALNSKEEIEIAEPNYVYSLFKTPNDTHYSKMWSLPKINAPAAWDITEGSPLVTVAVIDSGIDQNHPDLQANIAEVKNFTGCGTGDQAGHGTHVAGTVAAVGNNGAGVTGVAPKVKIMALKVGCSGQDITLAAVASALDYARNKKVQVINMSLGGSAVSQTMANLIANAVADNITVVVAAGNDGAQNANQLYPANDPNVITVSATGPRDELAHYSSYGSVVDVAAPGGNPAGGSSTCVSSGADCIVSTYPNSRYVAMTGTSMASPHVAGLVALLYSKDPAITSAKVRQILQTTSLDLGTSGKDVKFGYGRVDAKKALDAVSGSSSPTSTPTPPIDCNAQKEKGDYDCNSGISMADFESWRRDFIAKIANLRLFEAWRSAFQKK